MEDKTITLHNLQKFFEAANPQTSNEHARRVKYDVKVSEDPYKGGELEYTINVSWYEFGQFKYFVVKL